MAAGIGVKVATLPPGEDPDSLIKKQGTEAFRSFLKNSVDFFDHAIDRAEKDAMAREGSFGPRQKAAIGGRLAAYIALLPEAVLRETTTTHVGARLGLSANALADSAARSTITAPEETPEPERPRIALKRVSASAELICRLALTSREVREWLKMQTSPTPTELDPELSLLDELLTPLQGIETPSLPELLARVPEHLQPLVSSWEFEKIPGSPLAAVQDAFLNLRLKELKKRQQEAALLLKNPGLERNKMLSIQKEILDLQNLIYELTAPANPAPPALR
jgi:DNA primase